MVAFMNAKLLRAMAALAEFRGRLADERGQDLIEYALLGGVVAALITAVAAVLVASGAANAMATGIANCIDFDDVCP